MYRALGSLKNAQPTALLLTLMMLGLLNTSVSRAEEPSFALSAHGSLQAFRMKEPPRGSTSEIHLSAARCETESFQLVLSNRSSEALRDIRVSVAGLKGVTATVYAAAAIHMPKPGRSGGAPSDHYFDLLRPAGAEHIATGQFRPYWIDLRIGSRATAGVQRGHVTVVTPKSGARACRRTWDAAVAKSLAGGKDRSSYSVRSLAIGGRRARRGRTWPDFDRLPRASLSSGGGHLLAIANPAC
jgi:hypothetical protein